MKQIIIFKLFSKLWNFDIYINLKYIILKIIYIILHN
jgi:hypothetical protein